MVRESDYTISEIVNDLTHYWTNLGYVMENDVLIIKRPEVTEQFTSASDSKTLKVSTLAHGRPIVSLRKAFGSLVFDATHISVNNNFIPIRRADKRVEVKKYNIEPGEFIDVELFISDIVTEMVIKDEIPTTRLIFSTFVKGEYPNRRTGVIERRIIVSGDKVVVVGIRAPLGASETQFWNMVFSRLKSDVIDEFKDRLTVDEEFEREELDEFPDWSILEDQGDFPRSSGELR